MNTEESKLDTFLSVIFRPRLLLQGTVEYASAWLFTRRWLFSFAINLPWLLLGGIAISLVTWGAMLGDVALTIATPIGLRKKCQSHLASLEEDDPTEAEESLDSASDADETSNSPAEENSSASETANDSSEGEVSPYGELLLRRLLKLQRDNSRVTYLVAAQLARNGRTGQARQMMRRVAPVGGGGFAPAHTWLAVDQISRQAYSSREEREQLEADLATGRKWKGVNPQLVAIYASFLEQQGKVGEALSVLEEGSQNAPELSIAQAQLAERSGRKQSLQRITSNAKDEIQKRMRAGEANATDLVNLANYLLIEKDPDRALRAVETANELNLVDDSNVATFERLQSEAYRVKYLSSAVFTGENASVNLGLLDAALKSDPTNPGVGVEIARLLAIGQSASPELKKALEQQLVSGQATALTHILLANRQLQDNQLEQAIPHLEIAFKMAPNSPLVMNNLGLALAMTNREDLSRAVQLVENAVKAEPRNANYLDTLGQVREMADDLFGAVEAYESSIGNDGSRLTTRQRLAEIYEKLGMKDMAAIAKKEIAKLRRSP